MNEYQEKALAVGRLNLVLYTAWMDGIGLREIEALIYLIRGIHESQETHTIMLEAAAKIQSLIKFPTGEQKDGKRSEGV